MEVDVSKLLKICDDFYIFQGQQAKLGQGAFGIVYKGYCQSKSKIIAVKTVDIAKSQQDEEYKRQITTLKTLSTLIHPYIMGFYGFQLQKQTLYMFIQFCPNGDLTKVISKGLSQLQVLKYFRQMIQGMCYMNAKQIMHRDLKPENVLIGMDGDVKISDFGLAKQASNLRTTGKTGTPLYAGPEVYLSENQSYTKKCDVWGAGLILYEMLTQKRLFDKVTTYTQLNTEWKAYEQCSKRVQYASNFHPLWQYFTNLLLTFDEKKRPTFHQVLQILKKVYPKMQKQLQSGKTLSKSPKLIKLQLYLSFLSQKSTLLTSPSILLPTITCPLHNSISFNLISLLLCKYLQQTKKLIRKLKNNSLQLPNYQDQLIQNQTKDYQLVLCMDGERRRLEASQHFYAHLLKTKFTNRLQDQYQGKQIFTETKNLWELIVNVNKGLFDIQGVYQDVLREVLSGQLVEKGVEIAKQKDQFLKFYITILLAANIDQNFDQQKYEETNYAKKKIQATLNGQKQELLTNIKQLKAGLKI